ncbi:MAG: cell division protein FtsA [Alkalispirochaetaceae bacterium]
MVGGDTIVGLDIGTSKVTAVVGEYNESGVLEIVGIGTSLSSGLRRGVVINIEATLRSVLAAVEAAEQMAGREVQSVVTGIAGSHIEGLNSRGVVAVTGKGREITPADVDRVIEAARAVSIPMDREILHVIPRSFTVDDQDGIRNPLDMIGVRLEVDVHIVTGSVTAGQNLVKCVNRAGFKVDSVIFDSFAAAEAVLVQDEKDLGVMMIDIGGGTTDVVVYLDGAPYFSTVIPIGGQQVTGDLSIMLKTPIDIAEKLKREAGYAFMGMVEEDEPVIIPGVGGRPPISRSREQICEIIQPRMAEILTMARDRVEKKGLLPQIGGGIVLTGGGALLPGAVELAQEIFRLGARLGEPGNYGGLVDRYQSPEYATAVGLVRFAAREGGPVRGQPSDKGSGVLEGLRAWMKNFFE